MIFERENFVKNSFAVKNQFSQKVKLLLAFLSKKFF